MSLKAASLRFLHVRFAFIFFFPLPLWLLIIVLQEPNHQESDISLSF